MPSWSQALKEAAWPVWEAIFAHPFVTGLSDDTLPADRFRYFLGQDYVYLQDFSRVLAMGAARTPHRADEPLFLRHALTVHEVEADLHRSLAPAYGLTADDLAATPPGPVTVAYTDHLVRAAWSRPFAVLVAAVLPCYWIYREVGRRLAARPLPDTPAYREWITTYAGDPYGQAVDELLAVTDRLGERLDPETARAGQVAFWRSSRYEWLFWEQAWSLEQSLAAARLPAEPR
jgi:thiaminase/transcriptional activator TenA